MRRRQFIASATTTVAAASIAGCSGILGSDGGSSGPEGAVGAYVDAGAEGDQEALQDAVHPDAPSSVVQGAAFYTMYESVSVDSTEVVEEGEGQATVEATIEYETSGESGTDTSTFEVRTNEDGDWKVYSAA